MKINTSACLLLALVLCGSSAQEFGERLTRQSPSARNNGYSYPEPSPPFTLPPLKLDYLPPPQYIDCTQPQTCETREVCSQLHGGQPSPAQSSGSCLVSGTVNEAGMCCNPAPTTTQRATTIPSLEYLPPTTSGYKYPVPENPLRLPDSNNEKPIIVAVPPPSAPVVDEDEIPFWDFRESIPGEPEIDYPILDKIPVTSFSCEGKVDGYYANMETRCQVFHICSSTPEAPTAKFSFLCPNGTIFDQQVFACTWWPDVNCEASSKFFDLNKNIGIVSTSHGTNIKSTSTQSRSVAASARGISQVGSRPSLSISAAASV